MKFKIDLHVHSLHSVDAVAEPEDSVRRAIEIGLQGIAFTEHASFEVSEPVERLRETYGNEILILRGVEFSTAEGHCLVFGVNTDRLLAKFAPADELLRVVNEAGGAAIPSHPFRPGNSMGDLVLDLRGFTALEGHNGANMHAMNQQAVEAAQALNLPFTGGSDAHSPREVGSCYTEFSEKVTEENFIELLRAGQYRGVDRRKISRFDLP